MSKLRQLHKDTYVADIKYDYIVNIVDQAEKCKGIDKVVLFGSSLSESCNNNSDIDIAVKGSITEADEMKIRNEFDLLEIPYTVDLVFINKTEKEELLNSIKREGIKLG